MEYANKSFESIDTKQKDIASLISKVDNFTKAYSEKPKKIEQVRYLFAGSIKIATC
jgi:hypothetical protein